MHSFEVVARNEKCASVFDAFVSSELQVIGQGEAQDHGGNRHEVEPGARMEDLEQSIDEAEDLLIERAIAPPVDADVDLRRLLLLRGSP